MMLTGETLRKILEIVRETQGYFVFREGEEEFILARRADFSPGTQGSGIPEKQLPLPATGSLAAAVRREAKRNRTTAQFVLDAINKEIADFHAGEREKELDDLSLTFTGKKVRFEPLTGDLPPELQE